VITPERPDAARRRGHHVLAEHDVGSREPVDEVVVDHRPRPRRGLLGRLEHGQQRPVPGVARRGETRRRAREPGDVHVVAAGVHHPVGLAGVVEPGLLVHRERVHVGAQEHRRALAVPEHADDAGLPHPRRDLEAGRLQARGGDTGRPLLLHRQLGVPVHVLVERLQVVEHRVDPVEDAAVEGAAVEGRPAPSVAHGLSFGVAEPARGTEPTPAGADLGGASIAPPRAQSWSGSTEAFGGTCCGSAASPSL
jgi:hypothetical protein